MDPILKLLEDLERVHHVKKKNLGIEIKLVLIFQTQQLWHLFQFITH